MTDWVNEVAFEETILPGVESWLVGLGVEAWLVSLIVDGILAGVGAVLGFLPQLLVLFLLLAQIGQRIYQVEGVENYHIASPANDVTVERGQLPVLGTLAVEELV